MRAWHFTNGDKLRDGRPLPKNGELLKHNGPVNICESGLHASKRIIDALGYSPGSIICRVECGDIVETRGDKLVCRERTILWRVDGENLLKRFTRKCARDVAHLWDMPDIVRQYLYTGDEDIRSVASSAASSAASCAASCAASRAASCAAYWAASCLAYSAASRAASRAAYYAAYSAASSAASSAAYCVASYKQNRRLTALVIAEHKRESK